jgi:hypothetical protein
MLGLLCYAKCGWGGVNWQTINLPDCNPQAIQFIDSEKSYFISREYAAMGHFVDYLWWTIDGGLTWKMAGAFNEDAHTLMGPLFIDRKVGWRWDPWGVSIPQMQPGTKDAFVLEMTTDGGFTWQGLFLPISAGLLEVKDINSHLEDGDLWCYPEVQNLGVGVVSISLACSMEYASSPSSFVSTTFYLSSDQGQSWQALSRPGETFFVAGRGWRYAIFDGGGLLEETTDNGLTWVVFPRKVWTIGEEQGMQILLSTNDGGKTWLEILPAMEP